MSTNPPHQIQVRPTSAHTAECGPIILRITDSVRLVFKPVIVNNPKSPNASIDGHFVWERKRPSDAWEEISNQRLTSLISGQGFRLTLRAQEVLDFYEGLSNLYELHQQKGVPKRRGTFVNVKDSAIAEFLAKGELELSRFFNAQREDDAAKLLLNLLGWLAQSSNGTEAVRRLVSTTPERLPQLTALLGLTSLKDGIEFYKRNKDNPKEEFWQQELSKRSYLFSQVFSYPIVIIGEKAYLGGKQFDYRGGYISDFVGKVSATDSVILIEIKTPQTRILGSKYREGIYPLSQDVNGAVAQILKYRQTFEQYYHTLRNEHEISTADVKCLVIAGNTDELNDVSKKECFEMHRERLRGVTLLSFNELFKKVWQLIQLLEKGASSAAKRRD